MRFSEKLPKLRKDNNFSQEQLADKLGVSRQAVSKWESGSSYPDMEKLLQMCKILNCNLEDIMDDGVIGNEQQTFTKKRFNINTSMNDFLDFITRTYNMFCSMKFKEKMKCLFEMTFLCLLLIAITAIVFAVTKSLLIDIIDIFPGWVNPVINLLGSVYLVLLSVIDAIVFLHLFKIRYLNYFITIEDQNAIERTIEEPVEKKENKYYKEQSKEKIIIRDPKHTAFSFFDILGKMILFIIKILFLIIAVPVIIGFTGLSALTFMSLYHVKYGMLFFWSTLAFLGATAIGYVALEWLYKFIFDKQQCLKRLFIIIIAGLVLMGAGSGLGISTYLSFDNKNYNAENYLTKTDTLEMTDKLVIEEKLASDVEYKIDDSMSSVKIEVIYPKELDVYLKKASRKDYDYYFSYSNIQFDTAYKIVLNDIKNKTIRVYDNGSMGIKLVITTSKENCEKLKENYYNLYHN